MIDFKRQAGKQKIADKKRTVGIEVVRLGIEGVVDAKGVIGIEKIVDTKALVDIENLVVIDYKHHY